MMLRCKICFSLLDLTYLETINKEWLSCQTTFHYPNEKWTPSLRSGQQSDLVLKSANVNYSAANMSHIIKSLTSLPISDSLKMDQSFLKEANYKTCNKHLLKQFMPWPNFNLKICGVTTSEFALNDVNNV